MRVAISAESTNDLPKELLEKYDVKVIPYQIVLKDKEIKDGELTVEQIFDYVEQSGTLPKTNALNEFEYTEFFEELKKDYDAVVHVALSSGLTSSCNNAIRASKNLENVFNKLEKIMEIRDGKTHLTEHFWRFLSFVSKKFIRKEKCCWI